MTGELQERIQRATRCLQAAQQRKKAYADKNIQHVMYEPGDEVLLSTENVQRTGIMTPKFMPLWIGPFKIARKVEEKAYELELAANMRMHDVFHVSPCAQALQCREAWGCANSAYTDGRGTARIRSLENS